MTTAIDDFLIKSRDKVSESILKAVPNAESIAAVQLAVLKEIHSVLTVIAQNMPVNAEAYKK